MWDVRLTGGGGGDTTGFQAEIHALAICARGIMEKGYKRIQILSESRAAIKALANYCISSQRVWDSNWNILLLAKSNKVALVWVSDYKGKAGNERAYALASEGSANAFTGPELLRVLLKSPPMFPFLAGLSDSTRGNGPILRGIHKSKLKLYKQSLLQTFDMLRLSRPKIRVVTGLITGYCNYVITQPTWCTLHFHTLYWCSMSRLVSGITCPSSGGTTRTQNWWLLCAVVDVGWSQNMGRLLEQSSHILSPHLQLHTIATNSESV
jgi:ribonuclease HI